MKLKNNLFLLPVLLIVGFFLFPEVSSAAPTGSGTEADPYVVGNAADLTTALKNGSGVSSTIYIQLSNDITYTASDQFTISSNVIVNGLKTDGTYYKMLYTGTNFRSSTAGFCLSASGYDVTFENMSFGDSTYSYNQTYYGILLGQNYQTDLIVKNVDYYGYNGGQPLLNYNVDTTFTFEGINNFNVTPGTNSEEFMEGATITFASNSINNISQISSAQTAFIYNSTSGTTTTINVEDNAVVNISTNKTYFVYGSRGTINLNVADSASFIYSDTNTGVNFTNRTNSTSNYTVGNNATLAFSGAGKIGNSVAATATINATTPAEISFENTAGTGLFNGTSTLTPSTNTPYLFNYTVNGAVTSIPASTGSTSLADSTFATNVSKVVYFPKATVSFDATSSVTDAIGNTDASSSITVSNITVDNSNNLTNAEYKVFSTSPLADGADINSDSSQSTITNASNADYSGTITENSFSLDQVVSGTYTIFVRGTATSTSGRITQTTPWVAKTVTVDKTVLNVSIPIEMTFAIVNNDEFTSKDTYTTINRSNYPITFGVNSISQVDDITLVNDINNTDATNPLYLALRDTADSSAEIPFVSDGTVKTFSMEAFGGSNSFKLVGQYGGKVSINNVTDIKYTLNVSIGTP